MSEHRVLVRVQMPDRPGALGLVASRVGAVKGDIVGIEVLDRTAGEALDELAVVLPDASLLGALQREISEVDGTEVESLTSVTEFPEPRRDALRAAARLATAHRSGDAAAAIVATIAEELRADWCALVRADAVTTATAGAPGADPDRWRATAVHAADLGPDELLVGRDRPLRPGEVELLDALRELVRALGPAGVAPTGAY